jgi:hypothetical protein
LRNEQTLSWDKLTPIAQPPSLIIIVLSQNVIEAIPQAIRVIKASSGNKNFHAFFLQKKSPLNISF